MTPRKSVACNAITICANAARVVAIVSLLLVAAGAVDAQPIDLSAYQDEQWVLLVISNDREDDRPFVAQLELSSQWERVNDLGIEVLDVLPGGADVAAVLTEYGFENGSFGLVLVHPSGDVAFRTEDAFDIEYMVDLVDEAEILEFVNRRGG